MPPPTSAVVLDLGGVLVHWDPRGAYRGLLPDDAAIEAFLEEVGFAEWNHAQDAGRPFAAGIEELGRRHPHRRELIAAYPERFDRTLLGEVEGTVALLEELATRGIRLLALTNWSAETFPHARDRFAFLSRFEDVVVSGELGLAKPDPAVFRHLVEHYALEPATTVFVDDSPANVAAATAAGLDALRFTSAEALRADLAERGLVAPAT